MKKLASCIVVLVSFGISTASADNHLTTGVVQAFGCSLNDGRTMADARSVLGALAQNAAANENPDPQFGLFAWRPLRGATDFDFVLGVINADLKSAAAGIAAFEGSPEGQALRDRFEATADCVSGIFETNQIADGTIGMTGGDAEVDAIVETFSCQVKDGSDMDDVDAAVKFWQAQVAKIKSQALDAYDAHVWKPIRGGTGADLIWVGNAANMEAWAASLADYNASPAGQAADARIFKHATCTSNLYQGYWLVAPKEF